jgi:hypothetical protein
MIDWDAADQRRMDVIRRATVEKRTVAALLRANGAQLGRQGPER